MAISPLLYMGHSNVNPSRKWPVLVKLFLHNQNRTIEFSQYFYNHRCINTSLVSAESDEMHAHITYFILVYSLHGYIVMLYHPFTVFLVMTYASSLLQQPLNYNSLEEVARYRIQWGKGLYGLCYFGSSLFTVEWENVFSFCLAVYLANGQGFALKDTLTITGSSACQPRVDDQAGQVYIARGRSQMVSVVKFEGSKLSSHKTLECVGSAMVWPCYLRGGSVWETGRTSALSTPQTIQSYPDSVLPEMQADRIHVTLQSWGMQFWCISMVRGYFCTEMVSRAMLSWSFAHRD